MNYYRKSNPSDVRDLSEQMNAWEASDNPKRHEWALQPDAPPYSVTQHAPEWVNGAWVVRDKTAEEIAAENALPDAEKYQVLDWLDDHGITSAHVDAALQFIPDETQRRKALLRWHSVNRIPADNAFVVHVANQLNIDHREAWSQILAK